MSLQLTYWKKCYGLKIGPVIHIGASFVQERFDYEINNMEPVLWVEGLPEVAQQANLLLANFPEQKLINAVVSDVAGCIAILKRASNKGESSSLFESGIQSLVHPKVKFRTAQSQTSTTIDHLVQKYFSQDRISLIVLDIQGAELLALKGGRRTLEAVEFIFSEVSTVNMYKKQPHFRDISKFLKVSGFSLIEHNLYKRNFHGNALYIRTDLAIARDIRILKTPRSNNLYYLFLIYFRKLRNIYYKLLKYIYKKFKLSQF